MKAAYEKYKLQWMIEHDYSLKDFLHSIATYNQGMGDEYDEAYEEWEKEGGFPDGIWACYNEYKEGRLND